MSAELIDTELQHASPDVQFAALFGALDNLRASAIEAAKAWATIAAVPFEDGENDNEAREVVYLRAV